MKHIKAWYAVILVAIMGLIVVHAPLIVWLGTWLPDIELYIKAWKEILMTAAAVLAGILVVRSGRGREILSDRIIIVALGFVVLHIVSLLLWPGAVQAAAGLAIDLRYVVYFLLVYILVWLYPEYRGWLLRAAGIGAVVVVGFACLQLVLPRDFLAYIGYGSSTIEPYQLVDQNPDFVRSQSTLRGPNPFSAYMVMVVAGLTAHLLSKRPYRGAALAALVVSGGLLYLGYSRSALLAGVVAIAILLAIKYRRYLTPQRLWLVGTGALVVVLSLLVIVQTDFGSTVLLHNDPNESSQVNSDDQRIASLRSGVVQILHNPFGVGIGSTGSASLLGEQSVIIENQYLFIAHEVGIFGLALFVVLYVMILRRLWLDRRSMLASAIFASGIGLAIIGLFLPVWADDTVSIIWWGLAGIIIAGGRHGGQSTEQKTARTT